MRDTKRCRESRDTGRRRSRLHAGSPMWGSIPWPLDQDPSETKSRTLNHPGTSTTALLKSFLWLPIASIQNPRCSITQVPQYNPGHREKNARRQKPGSEAQLGHIFVSWLCVGHLITESPVPLGFHFLCQWNEFTNNGSVLHRLYWGSGEVRSGWTLCLVGEILILVSGITAPTCS